jgi:RNA polymerase sigma-70 factor (ECF subfamily)
MNLPRNSMVCAIRDRTTEAASTRVGAAYQAFSVLAVLARLTRNASGIMGAASLISEKPGSESAMRATSSILDKVAEGDPVAVDECIARYGDLIWSMARRWCFDAADAEDATQDIFIDLWQTAGRYDRSKSAEVTYVAMVARRRLIDRLRRRRPNLNGDDDWQRIDLHSIAEESLPVDKQLELREDADRAEKCLGKLAADQNKVLRMSIYQGLPHRIIAEQASMPLGTVKSYIRRSLLMLRDCMNRKSAGESTQGLL